MSKSIVLSIELKSLLDYIKEKTVVEFPIQTITLNYLVLSILDNVNSDGYTVLSKCMLNSDIIEFKEHVINEILLDTQKYIKIDDNINFADDYEDIAHDIEKNEISTISSALMLEQILLKNENLFTFLKQKGVSKELLHDTVLANVNSVSLKHNTMKPSKIVKRKTSPKKTSKPIIDNNRRTIISSDNIVEKTYKNLNIVASHGLYDDIIGYDDYVDEIFNCFAKYNRTTVAIVGPIGAGKTSIVHKLVKYIYNQICPQQFKNKYVMEINNTLSLDIVEEMNEIGKYIAFIDDADRFFLNKENEPLNQFILTELFKSNEIETILCMSDKLYAKHIESKPEFSRLIHKITVKELLNDELIDVILSESKKFEKHNNVTISRDCVVESIRLCERYITNERPPMSVLNVLDTACAYTRLHAPINNKLLELENQLNEILIEKNKIPSSGSTKDFDLKDDLIRQEMRIQKSIEKINYEMFHNNPAIELTIESVRRAVANITNLPITDINQDDKVKLRNLYNNLTNVVIGQDDAVNDICQAIKRHRIGLSNPNKPCVILSVGQTGVGKSFLVKKLAYEMFGSEKNMVRLDMSEYSDKISVTKLYGASAGYIGYEEGGILTEAIKKQPYCVLLLDEIEKAHPDIYDVFLQIFDDGRLTDNKGNVVSFKNVIIIMTSNVGAKDVSEKPKGIGFVKDDNRRDGDKEIIIKSIKKEFKPEFINRIDNICYFNQLTDDNLKVIIKNEIKKVEQKVNNIGFTLDTDITEGKLLDTIFESVKEQSEYGARPILREIQIQLENKLTDFIINNDLPTNYNIKYIDIYK